MSRKIWGITLTVFAAALIAALVFWYIGRKSITPPEEQSGTELVEMEPAAGKSGTYSRIQETEPESTEAADASVDDPNSEDYQFILMDHNNYVAVYQLPEREIYEYTDVILEVLPADLQEEIRRGKYLRSEEELYNFLENYTS